MVLTLQRPARAPVHLTERPAGDGFRDCFATYPAFSPTSPLLHRIGEVLAARQQSAAAVPFHLLGSNDRRWIPFASEGFRLRAIKAHGQIETSLWRRKPVALLFLARAVVLEIEVERAIDVGLERHPTRNREAIQAISDLKSSRERFICFVFYLLPNGKMVLQSFFISTTVQPSA